MKIKRYDLLIILLSFSLFLLFSIYGWQRRGASSYLLIEDSRGRALYPLSENRDIHLEGPMGASVVHIEDGEARFTHSDCPDQLCVQMGPVDGSGDWAACLPNEVFISARGDDEEAPDAGVY